MFCCVFAKPSSLLQALDARVHHTILDLPGCAFQPEHAAHICAIMRHLLEDPATLQAAMEAEIRSALNQKTNRAGGSLLLPDNHNEGTCYSL